MASDESGRLVHGRYELLELAGDGGMAQVYRAVTRGAAGFQRPVALKRVHDHLANNTEFVRMFIEEARVCSELDHANVVQVHDFGVDNSGYYLVMEWVDGVHLGQYVKSFTDRGVPTPWRQVAAIMAQVLSGLAAAHERVDASGNLAPIIHRDVTPHNIMISVSGVAKLTDFGLARAVDRARMTSPDVVKGKLSYLAPELARGRPANERSDLYAVGIVLWEALTGERLYWADTDAERIRKVREGEVPPLRDKRADLPAELVAVVDRALDHDPEQRFESADDMSHVLLRVLGVAPVSPRELGQAVMDARVANGLPARSIRPPPTPGPMKDVLTSRMIVIKADE
ncbi:MAG: serine/threonine-protein kinase [Myxococcales bacterium]